MRQKNSMTKKVIFVFQNHGREELLTYLPKYSMSIHCKENAMSIYFLTLNLSKVSRRKRKMQTRLDRPA